MTTRLPLHLSLIVHTDCNLIAITFMLQLACHERIARSRCESSHTITARRSKRKRKQLAPRARIARKYRRDANTRRARESRARSTCKCGTYLCEL